ncbi:hypothetical protein [Paenibacillus sp. IHBB 3054]|uniref:hypothetical protein n=1 Tax=Paenibacillus sp. IHBB 3054 TaxID=3425689 RepID=UPI003F67220A
MNLKRSIAASLTAGFLLTASLPVYGETANVTSETVSPVESAVQTIDLQKGFENLSDDIIVSEVLTFDELVSRMAEKQGITEDEASSILINNYGAGNTEESRSNVARLATFRTLSKQLLEFNGYRPSLEFYCETSESGSFHGIVKILNTTLNPINNNTAKVFNGTIYVNLENASKIHYIVSGKFYHNGVIQSVTGNFGISVGGVLNIGISATGNTNLYYTTHEPGDLIW